MTYQLVLGDSRKHIQTLADHSVDLILTDPPYNLGSYSTGNIEMSWRKDFNNDVASWDQGEFDPSLWYGEFIRILKPTGNLFIFTSYNLLGTWHALLNPRFDTFQFMMWHKVNPPPKLFKAGFLNSCELIVCCWNKGHTWNFGRQRDMHNFIEGPICQGNERLDHPSQKPIYLLKKLLMMTSNPGDLVYDPFAGVGSTGEAALLLDRRFIGVEIDPGYFKQAQARLERIDMQAHLFMGEATS